VSINPRYVAAGAGLIAAMAAPVVMHFEGLRNDPYRDVVGVLTVCFGDTHGVEQRRYTDAECAQRLRQQLAEHDAGLTACVHVPMADNVHAAHLSVAYNVGVGAWCSSSAIRKLNAGDVAGSCAEMSRWTHAGGKELAGLVRRRAAERALCEGRQPLPVALGAIN
jgi:lysozyme